MIRYAVLITLFAVSVSSAQNQTDRAGAKAKQQAEFAVNQLRSGRSDAAWRLLRHTTDNSARSYLIHYLSAMNVDSAIILRRLQDERDVSVRRALILSLAGFGPSQLPAASLQSLIPRLLDWYRNDPDAGVHSAIDWLLRHGSVGEKPRMLDWQQAEALMRIDRELAERRAQQRGWYVTGEGQTFAILRGPFRFLMGAPTDEAGRKPGPDSPDEPLRRVRIPRSFAIGTKEVTVGEFQRFLDANPDIKTGFAYPNNPERMARVLQTFSPDADGPIIAVTWYEAAMYCNWLSKQEGIPESEWVYPANLTDIKDGMQLSKDYLHRTGYRLPTEAEWEFAARAGSTTSRFYGSSDELLEEYAWYSKNPPRRGGSFDPADPQRNWPVGQLKPNDFGLFDIHGNVWEWTQDRMQESFPPVMDDSEDTQLAVTDTQCRSRRGGAFVYGAAFQRAANRDTLGACPAVRRDNVGFRIARTLTLPR
jgi:formylglycine-generating enzyme required for sulfatase activity